MSEFWGHIMTDQLRGLVAWSAAPAAGITHHEMDYSRQGDGAAVPQQLLNACRDLPGTLQIYLHLFAVVLNTEQK